MVHKIIKNYLFWYTCMVYKKLVYIYWYRKWKLLWFQETTKNVWSDFTDGIEMVYKCYTKFDWYTLHYKSLFLVYRCYIYTGIYRTKGMFQYMTRNDYFWLVFKWYMVYGIYNDLFMLWHTGASGEYLRMMWHMK